MLGMRFTVLSMKCLDSGGAGQLGATDKEIVVSRAIKQ
jgi:hypothetical protein